MNRRMLVSDLVTDFLRELFGKATNGRIEPDSSKERVGGATLPIEGADADGT